jgi:hypothetical protein
MSVIFGTISHTYYSYAHRQTYAHNELVNYLLQSSNPQIFLAVNTILTIIGNPLSQDDLRDDASRISHDTRTSVDYDLDSHATLKDLKMLSLNQMGVSG